MIKFLDWIITRTPLFATDQFSKSQIIDSKVFKEALFLASPSLYYDYYNSSKPSKDAKIKLNKYVSRATTRPTPFGLFAFCGLSKWDDSTRLQIQPNHFQRITRLDTTYLFKIGSEMDKDLELRKNLKYYPNSSLYESFNSLRYIEKKYEGGNILHAKNQIENDQPIQTILRESKNGSTFVNLISSLVDLGFEEDDCESFINILIDEQVLVSELEPVLTSPYLEYLLKKLEENQFKNDRIDSLVSNLNKIKEKLKLLDSKGVNSISDYKKIEKYVNDIGIDYTLDKLFHVTGYRADLNQFRVNRKFQKDLLDYYALLSHESKFHYDHKSNMHAFIKKFEQVYDRNLVPFTEVFDSENGINYPVYDDSINTEDSPSDFEKKLFHSFTKSALSNYSPIDLSGITDLAGDTVQFLNDQPIIPFSFSLVSEKNTKNHQLFLRSIGGNNSLNLIGRFGHNEQIDRCIKEIVEYEKCLLPENTVFAEIVHLPQTRIGNILAHPRFYKHEITFLCQSTTEPNQKISIGDLYLKLIPGQDKKIILWSKKLNKQIIPRLSNAHNYASGSSVYRFLCDLQAYHLGSFPSFSWGKYFQLSKILPRVVYKSVIIKRKTWKLERKDFNDILDDKTDLENSIGRFQNEFSIPDKFVIQDRDNELLIDTSDRLSIEGFRLTLKKREQITLVEYLPGAFNTVSCTRTHNEFIAFAKNHAFKFPIFQIPIEPEVRIKSKFFPIDPEWVYLKIYCGDKTRDIVLKNYILPLTDYLLKNELIEEWFFIRYNDPKPHIRFRFKPKYSSALHECITNVNQKIHPLLKSKFIVNVQYDCYEREIDRYGSNTIEYCERLFFYDSLKVLKTLDIEDSIEDRLILGAALVNNILDYFEFDLRDKAEFIDRPKKGFMIEFDIQKSERLALDQSFRSLRKDLRRQLFGVNSNYQLQKFDKSEKKLAEKIKSTANAPLLDQIVLSLIHMSLNRAFVTNSRRYEMNVYYFMKKLYDSELARMKYSQS